MKVGLTKEELFQLIEEETRRISELEAKDVTPEYYLKKDGTPYDYPKGGYAVHVTAIKDAYWRRRNWKQMCCQSTGN